MPTVDQRKQVKQPPRDQGNHSLSDLARMSTIARKVKITLPKVSCLERPVEQE